MVAPCYFLACRIFEDAGLGTGAIREGEEGIDLGFLERRLVEAEKEMARKVREPFVLKTRARNRRGCVHHVTDSGYCSRCGLTAGLNKC